MTLSSATSSSSAPRTAAREISISGWRPIGITPGQIRAWATRALGRLSLPPGDLSVVFLPAKAMAKTNRRYRGKPAPTNVLSFRYQRQAPGEHILGEIFLCAPVIRREARAGGETFSHRLRFLLEHGLIHLTGRDHQTAADLRRWRRIEQRLRP